MHLMKFNISYSICLLTLTLTSIIIPRSHIYKPQLSNSCIYTCIHTPIRVCAKCKLNITHTPGCTMRTKRMGSVQAKVQTNVIYVQQGEHKRVYVYTRA